MITNLEIFNEPLLTAIGWSIIHIFWQGTLIALGLALLLRFLRKKSASLRYFIALASLLLLIGCIAYNFNAYYQESSKKFNHYSEIKLNKEAKPQKESAREYGVSGHQSQSLITRIKQQLGPLDQYFPLIVKFWLIGVILFTVKLILSFIYTNHLKKNTLKRPVNC